MDTLYGPMMFLLGGASTLIGIGLYAFVTVPRPRRSGFTVLSDAEGKRLHRQLIGRD